MFNQDFYPTPIHVIERMLSDLSLQGKTVLEPSAGKGDIIDFCIGSGANLLCCELDDDLAVIASSKAKLIAKDFLTVKSHQISHVDCIIMNPPFSADVEHINHAWDIAPDGCEIVALCNWETINNTYSRSRRILNSKIKDYGSAINLGDVFSDSERKTGVNVGLVKLTKPGQQTDFSDFFTNDEDEREKQENGLMSYNAVREIVQRYVNAIKLCDEVIENAVKMNALTQGIGVSDIVFTCSQDKAQVSRSEFAKEMQKKSWSWVINKMNLQKYSTRGLMDDINKFVEQQKFMKFTMKNIYLMIDAIIQTTDQRMDKALIEVFDNLTNHHHDNRYNIEGWKTNSHYLVNKKFINPWIAGITYGGSPEIKYGSRNAEEMEDFIKALCFVTGSNYANYHTLYARVTRQYLLVNKGKVVYMPEYNRLRTGTAQHGYENSPVSFKKLEDAEEFLKIYAEHGYSVLEPVEWGQWFDWGFFEVKLFKKGTGHFKFKDENVWALFNQQIARIKGFPLPENVKKSA